MEQSLDHSSHDEYGFVKVFIAVMGVLTLFTLFCIFMARALAPATDAGEDAIVSAARSERIAPVGQINTSPDQMDSQSMVAVVDTSSMTGPELVEGNCAACHVAGVAGAPKLDDAAEWEKRREAGLDGLVASVINGKGAMPARAGTSLSDDQLRLAVQHIAGFEPAESDGGSAEQATVEAAAAAPAATPELTDRVKSTVDGLCSSCHIAGVANAPKLGDKEAWAERSEKGLDEMVKVVAAGKGAMPPRGGTDLNDEELASAITYLMTK